MWWISFHQNPVVISLCHICISDRVERIKKAIRRYLCVLYEHNRSYPIHAGNLTVKGWTSRKKKKMNLEISSNKREKFGLLAVLQFSDVGSW